MRTAKNMSCSKICLLYTSYTYYKAEKDIAHLADILGHSSINTTRIYTMGSGEEEMKQLSNLGLIVRCG